MEIKASEITEWALKGQEHGQSKLGISGTVSVPAPNEMLSGTSFLAPLRESL
jgi:hypothetical protein